MKKSEREAYRRDYAAAKAQGKPFFPYAVYKDLIVASVAIGFVFVLAIWQPIGIGEPINPATTDFVPRPEWYFFFLFELLKIFKGDNALTPVIMATFIVPNILMVLLLVTPFIDRGRERRIWRRPIALTSGLLVIFGLAYLTQAGLEAPVGQAGAAGIELEGLDAQGEAGLEVYIANGCSSCHMIKDVGAPGPGPNLTDEGAKNRGIEWQIEHLKDPTSTSPGSSMPAFANLTDQQYDDLAVFLEGLGTEYR